MNNYILFFFVLLLLLLLLLFTLVAYKNKNKNKTHYDYYVSTLCIGDSYSPIRPHWEKRISQTTKNAGIVVYDESNVDSLPISRDEYAWWDILRMKKNIQLIKDYNVPVVHCDLDLILVKDITPIVHLPYDIIISMEHYGADAMPKECSKQLGFGVCTGFYILKPSSIVFIETIYQKMLSKEYDSYSDQVTFMNYITKSDNYQVKDETILLDGVYFTNKIIFIDSITICVLDFELITRDPTRQNNQYGNHIHIPNAGSTNDFIRFFYEDIEDLPDITAYY
jgi:hypothetical protein